MSKTADNNSVESVEVSALGFSNRSIRTPRISSRCLARVRSAGAGNESGERFTMKVCARALLLLLLLPPRFSFQQPIPYAPFPPEPFSFDSKYCTNIHFSNHVIRCSRCTFAPSSSSSSSSSSPSSSSSEVLPFPVPWPFTFFLSLFRFVLFALTFATFGYCYSCSRSRAHRHRVLPWHVARCRILHAAGSAYVQGADDQYQGEFLAVADRNMNLP